MLGLLDMMMALTLCLEGHKCVVSQWTTPVDLRLEVAKLMPYAIASLVTDKVRWLSLKMHEASLASWTGALLKYAKFFSASISLPDKVVSTFIVLALTIEWTSCQ